MTVEKNILSIEQLTAGYNGKSVLNNLNLTLNKGEICCVIGEEGAGKSTLVRALTRQIESTGKIIYNGINVHALTPDKITSAGIDFIVQGGNILKGFTVEEHIRLALSERQGTNGSIWEEIEMTLPKIPFMKSQVAGRLSGGERMLLSLACIISTDADLLILDEPTAGIAPEICFVIRDFLVRMKNEKRKTILLLEHNYDFAFEIADSVVTLKSGGLSPKFTPQEFRQIDFIDKQLYDFSIYNY